MYRADAEDIINWPGNQLDPDNPALIEDSVIVVPGGERDFVQWTVPRIARAKRNPLPMSAGPGACTGGYQGGAVGSGSFIWPASNRYLSGYNYSGYHPAIDIAAGLGAPIYSKLDMDIASALMSINAVKGVNIGAGMNAAFLSGEENSDEIRGVKGKTKFKSNNAGGILGGISTGQEILVSFAVKPTSSILKSRKTIDKFGKNTSISVKGRHDPCVGIRAVPIGEAMLNCVLLDHYLLNKAQCGK